jgi:charged multivesicular body protein 4
LVYYRDKLREQQQLAEEISTAITNNPIGEQLDEDELDAELEDLEQEAMDERMTKTGTIPVADQLNQLPAAANGERESCASSRVFGRRLESNQLLT